MWQQMLCISLVAELYSYGCAPKTWRSWILTMSRKDHQKKFWWTCNKDWQLMLLSLRFCAGTVIL